MNLAALLGRALDDAATALHLAARGELDSAHHLGKHRRGSSDLTLWADIRSVNAMTTTTVAMKGATDGSVPWG